MSFEPLRADDKKRFKEIEAQVGKAMSVGVSPWHPQRSRPFTQRPSGGTRTGTQGAGICVGAQTR